VSNAPSKPVSFSRPKVGYFSNRPRTDGGSTYKSILIRFPNTKFSYNPFTSIRVATYTRPRDVNRKTTYVFTQWFQIRLFDIHIEAPTFTPILYSDAYYWSTFTTS